MALHGKNLLNLKAGVTQASSPVNAQDPDVLKLSSATMKLHQADSRKFKVAPPAFKTEGGDYAEWVAVELEKVPGTQLRFLVQRLQEDSDCIDERILHSKLTACGNIYRRSFVIDEFGQYMVHAMSLKDTDGLLEPSEVVSRSFNICPTSVSPLRGQLLRQLPAQMLRGMMRFAGASAKVIGPKVDSIRNAIARAAGCAESRVAVKLVASKKGVPGKRGVEVKYAVELERPEDVRAAMEAMTDPSLVDRISAEAGVSSKTVTVDAAALPLQGVLLHLSWTNPADGCTDYLDGSCMVYNEDQLLDVVDYRGPQSIHKGSSSSASCGWSAGKDEEASVKHSGDVMSKKGGRHAIFVSLDKLSSAITDCYFVLSAYNCRNLSKFESPKVCFFDAEITHHKLAEYSVAGAGVASASVVCSIARGEADSWAILTYGQTCDGTVRDYSPIEAAIRPVQGKYASFRRRWPLVRLFALWQSDRALPRATQDHDDLLAQTLDLRPEIFGHILSFI